MALDEQAQARTGADGTSQVVCNHWTQLTVFAALQLTRYCWRMGVTGWLPKHFQLDGLGWATSTHHGLENALKEILDERDSCKCTCLTAALHYSTVDSPGPD